MAKEMKQCGHYELSLLNI